MDRLRIAIAIILAAVVMIGWPYLMHIISPDQYPRRPGVAQQRQAQAPALPAPSPARVPAGEALAAAPPAATETTQVPERKITIISPYWTYTLSNQGAVATSMKISGERLADGSKRDITGADGQALQLIPQEVGNLTRPLGIRLPWTPQLATKLNNANYRVEGIDPNQHDEINLNEGDHCTITFVYLSPEAVVSKTFVFRGSDLVFDATVSVKVKGNAQPVELVIGPRFGDQSDKQTGSYSRPPGIIAGQVGDHVDRIDTRSITPPFAKITGLDEAGKRVELDKPLAPDVDSIQFLGSDGKLSLGHAWVTGRDNGGLGLVLDSLPSGVTTGLKVTQGADTRRHPFIWAGAADHYFAMIAVPAVQGSIVPEIVLTNANIKTGEDIREYPSVAVPVPDGGLHIFVGPKDRHILAQISQQVGADLEGLIDYGFFAFLIKPLAPLVAGALNLGYKIFHNYGWSIVAVTILVNLLLSPLRLHSSRKMKSAAKHQPRLKELQERMKALKKNEKKNEREIQELQREQMGLMKEANPLGGCLPLVLQMPIFWAFYVYLGLSLDIRHMPWILWVHNLAIPDPLKILPIIMCISMIGSSMLQPQPAAADPSMKMQRMMTTWLMPIFLTWLFFFQAPSGLVLYWMVSNLVGVAIQLGINKYTAEQPAVAGQPEKPDKPADRPRRKGKLQEKEVVGGVK
jgi:YidC/Oxa1 family membrane protein insertase